MPRLAFLAVGLFFAFSCAGRSIPLASTSSSKVLGDYYETCSSMPVGSLLQDVNVQLREIRQLYLVKNLVGTPLGQEVLTDFNAIYDLVYLREYEKLIEACQRARLLGDSLKQ